MARRLTSSTLLIRYNDQDQPVACWLVTDHRPHRVARFELDRRDLVPDLPLDLQGKVDTRANLPSVTIHTTKGATYHVPRVTIAQTYRQTSAGHHLRRLHPA